MKTKTIDDLIREVKGDGHSGCGRTIDEICVGFLRYEAVRKLHPKQFADLCARNLNGFQFDDLVDELVLKNEK